MTVSAGEASRKANASAPPAASRTCQRSPVKASRTRWRNEMSALASTAVLGAAVMDLVIEVAIRILLGLTLLSSRLALCSAHQCAAQRHILLRARFGLGIGRDNRPASAAGSSHTHRLHLCWRCHACSKPFPARWNAI